MEMLLAWTVGIFWLPFQADGFYEGFLSIPAKKIKRLHTGPDYHKAGVCDNRPGRAVCGQGHAR
jgi:hypothetical protein